LMMEDLNASFLAAFLDHIENTRANGARSRNLRLTAIRSFFRYAALESPQHSGLIQRVLAIPNKRQSRPLVDFLSRPEINALLAAPNRQTWLGRRDHTLLLTAVQTGLRLTEITSIRQQDVSLASGAHVRCEGKGRKERCTPLDDETALYCYKEGAQRGNYHCYMGMAFIFVSQGHTENARKSLSRFVSGGEADEWKTYMSYSTNLHVEKMLLLLTRAQDLNRNDPELLLL